MTLLLALMIMGCGTPKPASPPAVPSGGALFEQVPAYPGLRKLCETTTPQANGDLRVAAYASSDDLAVVRAFYEKNTGGAFVQPSGPRLLLRVAKDKMVIVGPSGQTDYSCGVQAEGRETEVTVFDFHRTVGEGITDEVEPPPPSPGVAAPVTK
jgi:hypothetical protein